MIRKPVAAVTLGALVVALGASPASAGSHDLPSRPELAIIVTSRGAAEAVPEGTWRFGLGVYPVDRAPETFARTFWRGAGPGDGVASTLAADGFGDLVEASGAVPVQDILDGSAPAVSFVQAMRLESAGAAPATVHVLATEQPYEWLARYPRAVVLGVGDRTPVLVVSRGTDPPGDALFDPSGPGHPGLLTPFDLTRTLADVLGLEVDEGYPGGLLGDVPDDDALGHVRALAAHLERSERWEVGVALALVALFLVAAIAGIALVRVAAQAGPHGGLLAGRGALAAARTMAFLPLGYLVTLFLPARSVAVHLVPLFLAVAAGIVTAVSPKRRAVLHAFAATAFAIAAITIVASFRAGSEPALSWWDSPVTSFRGSGLRNSLAAFLGATTLILVARMRRPLAGAALAVGAVAVLGSPHLGNNVVAVTAFTTGVATATVVRARGRLGWAGLAVSLAIGAAATGLTLVADFTDTTHAGRLLDATGSRGPGFVVDVLRSRLSSNLRIVGDVGPLGWAGLAGLIFVLVQLGWDAARAPKAAAGTIRLVGRLGPELRAPIAGMVMAAGVSLVLEDTGFLTAGTIAPFPIALAILGGLTAAGRPREPGFTAGSVQYTDGGASRGDGDPVR